MKTSLRIFGILLLGLFAISMAGCNGEDPPIVNGGGGEVPPDPPSPEEQLAGEYELIRLESNVGGVIEAYEPPAVEGNMVLVHGGSIYVFYIDQYGDEHTSRSDAWSATATTITVEGDPARYTLQGTTLTLFFEEPEFDLTTTTKWKKKT